MVESVEVKEMARRARLLKETLLKEVQEFYDRWSEKLDNLTRKHKAEQKKLATKGIFCLASFFFMPLGIDCSRLIT